MDSAVLVTGSQGALGAYVLRVLLRRGARVVGFDVSRDQRLSTDVSDGLTFAEGDVLDGRGLAEAMRRHEVERVIHLAALLAPRSARFEDVVRLPDVNVRGTWTLLSAAKAVGIKHVVLMSSKAMYGHVPGPYGAPEYRPLPEEAVASPRSLYGASKLMVELLGSAFAADCQARVVALRLGFAIMPGKGAAHGGPALLTHLMEQAMRGVGGNVEQGGDELLDIIYAGDIAEAIAAVALRDDVPTGAYNIGSGYGLAFSAIATTLSKKYGVSIETGAGLDPFGIGPMYSVLDISKAQRAFGFRPRFTLERMLDDYRDTLVRLGHLPSPLPEQGQTHLTRG